MRVFMILSLLVVAVGFSACRTAVKTDEYHVEVEDGHRHGDGDFCPPGQAKKGNC